jgi:hypothetical protein
MPKITIMSVIMVGRPHSRVKRVHICAVDGRDAARRVHFTIYGIVPGKFKREVRKFFDSKSKPAQQAVEPPELKISDYSQTPAAPPAADAGPGSTAPSARMESAITGQG